VARDLDKALGDGGMPILEHLGMCFEAYGDGWALARWTPTAAACNPYGLVHGGVYGVIHDAAMSFALNTSLGSGDRAATLEVSYQLLRSAEAGHVLEVRGEIVRATKQVAYLESRVHDETGELVSKAASTCLVRRKSEAAS
jgi:uncharacterized protein (TIGR00369 family)